jgi:hemolysin III
MIRTYAEKLTIEELANTVTHGLGLLLSVAGLITLIVLASVKNDFWYIFSSILYGGSLVVLYGASTLYHGATCPKRKETLRIVDHCCIYLLIAGTYTPFTLVVLRGTFGQGLFFFVWLFAVVGIGGKLLFGTRYPAISIISYLVMGWIGIFAIQPLLAALGIVPVALVVAGGLAYSIGTIFFGWKSLRHHHAIWHLFVLGGSICHFLAIALYVIPYVVQA